MIQDGDQAPDTTPRPRLPRQVVVAAVTQVPLFTGISIINPLIAPLSRNMGMPEWQIGMIASVASALLVVLGPWWGRRGRDWGRRRVVIVAVANAALSSVAFAMVAQHGLSGALRGGILFALLLFVRGMWFGLSDAAVIPNLQAHVAETTAGRDQRVRGMSLLGAGAGTATLLGAVGGGVLGGIDPLLALWATPLLIAVALAVVATSMATVPIVDTDGNRARAAHVALRDPRIRTYLVVIFCGYCAIGCLQILLGFLIQDRVTTSVEDATRLTAVALIACGLGLVCSQLVIVPRLSARPALLMRVGMAATAAGLLISTPDTGLAGLITGPLVAGIGMGMVGPATRAAASLGVRDDEQGSAAGLMVAAQALTFIIVPFGATALYGYAPQLPLILAVAIGTVGWLAAMSVRPVEQLPMR